MSFIDKYSNTFKYLLPNPLTIAFLLTLLTFLLAFFLSDLQENLKIKLSKNGENYSIITTEKINWSNGLTDDSIYIHKSELSSLTGEYKSVETAHPKKIWFTKSKNNDFNYHLETPSKLEQLFSFWYSGLWGKGGLTFAFQMMLMLVLGHVLALSPPLERSINKITPYCNTTAKAACFVTFFTLLTSWFNWGLGLIFGAIFARKVGEFSIRNNTPLNYGLVGAAGYSGLMIWHGGISGSSLIKVAENGHFKELISNTDLVSQLPSFIGFNETVFSSMNIFVTIILLTLLPLLMFIIGKKHPVRSFNISIREDDSTTIKVNNTGAERIDHSKFFSSLIGGIIVVYAIFLAVTHPTARQLSFITPNYINFLLLGLAILLNGSLFRFLSSLEQAIRGVGGILIQFPLYFGIMGIMSSSGMINDIASFFIVISNETTYPIYTLISAGLVNLFVPSGGGQWYVQGPIVIQTAIEMGISIPKSIMALAYGDQLTNMLQPFWALPLLGLTGLKAKEILPYTLILMLCGLFIFTIALILF